MKAFITKYALTKGIEEADDFEDRGEGFIKKGWCYFHGEGREWHRTRESAVQRALVMRDKKIASLRKAIGKLADLTFS
jgi:hypothetical protein